MYLSLYPSISLSIFLPFFRSFVLSFFLSFFLTRERGGSHSTTPTLNLIGGPGAHDVPTAAAEAAAARAA
jgi:hypothetical protein